MYENHSIMTATQQYADKNRLYAKKKIGCMQKKQKNLVCMRNDFYRKMNKYLIFGKWATLRVVRCAHYATLRKKQ